MIRRVRQPTDTRYAIFLRRKNFPSEFAYASIIKAASTGGQDLPLMVRSQLLGQGIRTLSAPSSRGSPDDQIARPPWELRAK